jgi:sporulation protein YlmC with PRC-barrel domain
MDSTQLNLGLRILDDQLIDAEEERFGRVDDIELAGAPGRETHVGALIVGAGAWRWRVPRRLAGLTSALTPNFVRRIPWELVREIDPGVVRIATTKGELGFGTAHHVGARWVDELEQGTLRLSSLLGSPVVRRGGEPIGRVHEVAAELEGSEARPGPMRVTGIIVGKAGWIQRLAGRGPQSDRQSASGAVVEWSRLLGWDDGRLVI